MKVQVKIEKESHPGPIWNGLLFGVEGNNGMPFGAFRMPDYDDIRGHVFVPLEETKESFAGISLFKANEKSECMILVEYGLGSLMDTVSMAPCEPWNNLWS